MLVVLPNEVNQLKNFKCGEVFCVTATQYKVNCGICNVKILFEEFPEHFQYHWTKVQEDASTRKVKIKNRIDQSDDEPMNKLDKLEMSDESLVNIADLKSNRTIQSIKPNAKAIKETKVQKDKANISSDDERDDPNCKADNYDELKPVWNNKDNNDDDDELEPVWENDNDNDDDDELDSVWDSEEKLGNDESKSEDKNELEPLWVADVDDKHNHFSNASTIKLDKEDHTHKKAKSVDEDDEPFACKICDQRFKTYKRRQYHMSVWHPKDKVEYKCDECNAVFTDERRLRSHKYKHTGIVCDQCGKTFAQVGNMLRHKIRHTGIKAFKCERCGKCFFTNKELVSHLLCHDNYVAEICEICGRPCRNSTVLKAHMRRHTGERPAKCDVCGKCFYSFHDLNVHAVAHTSERPFACDLCGSTFQRRKALRLHKRIHSSERNHICKVCGKGFAQSSGLKAHMRSHNTAQSKSTTKTDVNE